MRGRMPACRHLLAALQLLLLPADAHAQTARSFLIFFDFDRSELSPIATQIIDEAVKSATMVSQQGPLTGIEVRGHTDRASGSPAAAMAISLRAAEVVAGVIVAKGIPRATLHVI